jgi:hypothetical protein
LLDNELGESRERYHQLIERPADLEDILQHGAKKARAVATPFLNELREAVGLRSFVNQVQVAATTKKKAAKAARSSASAKTTAASASVCWRPMASNCCCRATSPTAKPPAR